MSISITQFTLVSKCSSHIVLDEKMHCNKHNFTYGVLYIRKKNLGKMGLIGTAEGEMGHLGEKWDVGYLENYWHCGRKCSWKM